MVLIYSNEHDLTLEMLSKGRELADELGRSLTVVVMGSKNVEPEEYIGYGADKVFVAETDLDVFKPEEYTQILQGIIKSTGAETILIGSNKDGKELAPRLASMLDADCVTDCISLYVEDGKLTTERVVYSGNAVAVERFNETPRVATIPGKLFDIPEKDDSRTGEVITEAMTYEPSPSNILNVQRMESEGVNVEDATTIVSCGRGFKNKEDIDLAEELAKLLPGEAIGCSRPISADLKWLSEDHWIGLSGHKVKPKLYVAIGISGQIQHIAGMRDSDMIVAINKDPEALIFKSADYGIVGDLYQVLPKLVDAIKEKTT
ncbi:MAG: electron transfer flavoprotein subunit alpha/FixB family protein [Thermoplasmata archaeon]